MLNALITLFFVSLNFYTSFVIKAIIAIHGSSSTFWKINMFIVFS